MSKKANPALVGAFVLGALALVVTAVIIFGGGHFFRPTERYILYFEGSVKGLNVGAPVMFRGVQVGSVVDIRIEFDENDLSFRIPVTIEVLPDRFTQVCCEDQGPNRPLEIGTQEFIDLMVAQGLRAQLQSQSFVTGQLLVLIDLFPERPPRFAEVETSYPQLPTIPSGFEELTRTLEELPLAEIAHKLVATLEGIEQFVRSPQLGETLRGVGETLEEVKALVGSMEGRLERADRELSATLKTTRDLLTHLDGQLQPLAAQWGQTAQAGQEALEETRRVMATLGETLGEESLLHVQLERALGELAGAARALRDLSEYLERHPDALLRGKGGTSP